MKIKNTVLAARCSPLVALLLVCYIFSQPLYADESPYSKWINGPPANPNFFPIAVWLQNPANAPKFKEIGINTYIGLWDGPNESQLAELNRQGMQVVCYQNSSGLSSANNNIIRGWMQMDEPDNAQWNGSTQQYDACINPAIIQQRYSEMVKYDPTRPVYLNLGRAVSEENWIGRGVCTGRLDMYPEYIKGADIISFDIYPVTEYMSDRLEAVAKGVERLVSWAEGKKIVWNVIETTHIQSQAMPNTHQIKAEVWMSIICGSMGITYFVHEWIPGFGEDAIFRYPEIVEGVKEINREITQLAPVLNSKTIENAVEAVSSSPIKTMVKNYDNSTYIFAVAMRNASSRADFSISGLTGNVMAEIIGENRQIEVKDGKFEDYFEEYGVHLYRIRAQAAALLYGDVDGDGRILAYDAALVAMHIVRLRTLTRNALLAANVDGDLDASGKPRITVYDAALIARRAVRLISRFAVEE